MTARCALYLVGVVNSNLGEEEVVGIADGTIQKSIALVTSHRPSIVTFPLS